MKIYLKHDGKTHRWVLRFGRNTAFFKTSKGAIKFINEVKAFY